MLALATSLALPAIAAIPDATGVIHACYNVTNGNLRVIDPSTASCRIGEAPLQWNVQEQPGTPGAPGAPGSPGAAGPAGPPGIALAWAHVRAAAPSTRTAATSPW